MSGARRRVEDGPRLGQVAGFPGGERRVVGDEVVAQAGFFLGRFLVMAAPCEKAGDCSGGSRSWYIGRRVKQVGLWSAARLIHPRLDVILIILIKMEGFPGWTTIREARFGRRAVPRRPKGNAS